MFGVPKFGLLELVGEVADYVISDQEKEGRELAITKTAEVYSPILKQAKEEYEALMLELERQRSDFETQHQFWLEKGVFYENQNITVLAKIERLKKEKPKCREAIENSMNYGLSFAVKTRPDVFNLIAGLIHKRMDKKRQKYYLIQFEISSKDWKEKIAKYKLKYENETRQLKDISTGNKTALNQIISLVNQKKEEYEKNLETYNFFKDM